MGNRHHFLLRSDQVGRDSAQAAGKLRTSYDSSMVQLWLSKQSGFPYLALAENEEGWHEGGVCRQCIEPDPITALHVHARVNKVAEHEPVACGLQGSRRIALTTSKLVKVFNDILKEKALPLISGHCFRIGGTTTLLLKRVPPDIVKMLVRWTSDSFLRYWRSLEVIGPMYVEMLRPILFQ